MTIHAAIKYYNDLADDIDKNSLPGDSSTEPRQLAEWLEELKIFKELYPDTDVKGSLRKNYEQGWEDAIDKFLKIMKSRLQWFRYNEDSEWFKAVNYSIMIADQVRDYKND